MGSPDTVEELEIRLFLEAVRVRYGYDLRGYARPAMRRRLHAVLARHSIPHMGELQHRALTDAYFFAEIVEGLTVQVSEMFRFPPFYRAFRTKVVPILRTYPQLKIWHAGCANGEEAYATAIMLREEGLYDRAQIYATDVSVDALERARAGVYSADKAALFEQNYRDAGGTGDFSDYYTAAYDRIAAKNFLQKNILFFQHNLVSDHVFGEMHVVFCRNVMIYFGADLRKEVLSKFVESLCPGGFLCLGNSERIQRTLLETEFSEFAATERIYRRQRGHA